MNTVKLGPAIHCEGGYQVCEVQTESGRPEGFTFEGPGFPALIIYPSFDEALLGLRALASNMTLRSEPST
jgi:hypothetical protein